MEIFSFWNRNYRPSEASSSSGDTKGKTPVYDGVRRSAQEQRLEKRSQLDLDYMIRWNKAAQDHQKTVNEQLKEVSEIIQEIAGVNKKSVNKTWIENFWKMLKIDQKQTNQPDNSEPIQAKKSLATLMQDFNNYISAEGLDYNAKKLGGQIPSDVFQQFFVDSEEEFKQASKVFFKNNQDLKALAEGSKDLLEFHKKSLIDTIEQALTSQTPAEAKGEEASRVRENLMKGKVQPSERFDNESTSFAHINSDLRYNSSPKEFLEGVLRYYIQLSQRANRNMLQLTHNQQFIEYQQSIKN